MKLTTSFEHKRSKANSELWNTGLEKNKELVRTRKRRLHYVSNIYVVKDPGNPDNEGKVFLFKFGKKIFDKIADAMQPEYEDEEPINPFDFWDGADFKLKIRNVEGYRNYDKSEFDKQSEFMDGNDDELEKVYKQLNPLNEIIDPKNFKSYEELEKKFKGVLGVQAPSVTAEQREELEDTAETEPSVKAPEMTSSTDDDEDLEFFKKLAEED